MILYRRRKKPQRCSRCTGKGCFYCRGMGRLSKPTKRDREAAQRANAFFQSEKKEVR